MPRATGGIQEDCLKGGGVNGDNSHTDASMAVNEVMNGLHRSDAGDRSGGGGGLATALKAKAVVCKRPRLWEAGRTLGED